MANIFITGISSGIGLGIAGKYLEMGWNVYGLSRRECPLNHDSLHEVNADLNDTANLPGALYELFDDTRELDLVVLNAGVLGTIADMKDVQLPELKKTMDINLWSNKVVLDWLFKHMNRVDQVVAISSGAAVNGSRGWNGYSISKAALNMLVKLYSVEQPETHFISFAPGLVDTAMQDYLCSQTEVDKYPSLSRIQASRGTDGMPHPEQLAEKLPAVFEEIKSLESGGFIDIRKM